MSLQAPGLFSGAQDVKYFSTSEGMMTLLYTVLLLVLVVILRLGSGPRNIHFFRLSQYFSNIKHSWPGLLLSKSGFLVRIRYRLFNVGPRQLNAKFITDGLLSW